MKPRMLRLLMICAAASGFLCGCGPATIVSDSIEPCVGTSCDGQDDSSDTTPPSIAITSPANGSTVAASTVTVAGTASDDVALANVEVRVGAGAWAAASGTASWSAAVTLASGPNTVFARATDTAGNENDTSITIVRSPDVEPDTCASIPDEVKINPDKTICLNGKKTFPIYIYGPCNAHFEGNTGAEPCDPAKNNAFDFGLGGEHTNFTSKGYQPKFEKAGLMFTLGRYQISGIPQQLIDSPVFFGFLNYDEPAPGIGCPDTDTEERCIARVNEVYSSFKNRNSQHPVILNHWRDMKTWAPANQYGDILTWDGYAIAKKRAKANKEYITTEAACIAAKDYWSAADNTCYYWDPADHLYAWEQGAEQNFFKGTNLNTIGKPVYAVLQANGLPCCGGMQVPTPEDVRGLTYTAITTDVKGIGYWGYLSWGGTATSTPEFPYGTSGLYNTPALHSYYKLLTEELRTLNDILVLPTKDYSWHYHSSFTKSNPDEMVTFSKNWTKSVWWRTRYNFNYILKQSGNTYYLIVVNKDSRALDDVEIKISGLAGSTTATTLGLAEAGSVPGRTLQVTDGKFTDSFDGYAAHVYAIAPSP